MNQLCRIGLDIAKTKFHLHAVDNKARDMFSKQLNRNQVLPFFANLQKTLVGIEACAGAHHWARQLKMLGHDARLISPRLVKPFVINNKTDAADAKAICEVLGRPSTKFVTVKTIDQQTLTAYHRVRERLVANRTALVNQARGLLNEVGITIPQGIKHMRPAFATIINADHHLCHGAMKKIILHLYEEFEDLEQRIKKIEHLLQAAAKTDPLSKRLLDIPGLGYLTATAIVAHVGDAKQFKNGRQFAACIGLTPKEHSSGGKQKLLGITKRGNSYIRKLLIQGARIVVRHWTARVAEDDHRKQWIQGVATRRGALVAAVAQANKNARIAWAVLARGEEYRANFQPAKNNTDRNHTEAIA